MMALRCNLRSIILQHRHLFSTSSSSRDSSRAALSLIRFEQNPDRILDICRSTVLNPDSHLSRLVYSKAITKLRDANDYDAIRAFIKDSLDKLNTISERVASHFIVLYGQGGLINDAIKLFDQMPAMGIERNLMTLNTLLHSCILACEYSQMKRIFLEFPGKYGLHLNLETYNTVLKGFCHSGMVNEVHAILAEMERKGIKPNRTTFSTVISGFYMEGNYTDVGKMMALMKKHGIAPGITIYNVRIQSLCKLKRSAEAKALLDGILGKGMVPNGTTYRHLVYGFCREGNLDMAKRLFKEMVDRELEPEAKCYFTLIYYLCQGRDFEAALGFCKDCMYKDWVPNVTTMKCLVNGLVGIGKVSEAREIVRQVKKKFSRNADQWSEMEEGLPK